MHSATAFAVLFALGAVAAPSNKHAHLHVKRDNAVVMTTEVVQETVTVGPGGNPVPTQNSQPQPQPQAQGYGAPVVPEGGGPVKIMYEPASQPQQPQQQQQQQQQAPPPPPPAYTAPAPPPSSSEAPPPPPPSTSAAAPSQPAPQSGYDKQGNQAPDFGTENYKQAVLLSHNCHRANHSASALNYDDSLADAARSWGQQCQFAHSSKFPASSFPKGYGQNIAAGTNDNDIAAVTSVQWYNDELEDFPFNQISGGMPPQTSTDTGHMTQVVWKGTTHVGCWTGYCDSMMGGAYYSVCNYGPAGNVMGEYGQNLSPPDSTQDFTSGT